MDFCYGIYRFALVDMVNLSVSPFDKELRKQTYCILRGVFQAVNEQNNKLLTRFTNEPIASRKRPFMEDYQPEMIYKKMNIVSTPPRDSANDDD